MRLFVFLVTVFFANSSYALTIDIPDGTLTFRNDGTISGASREIYPVPNYTDEIYDTAFSGSYTQSGALNGSASHTNQINLCCVGGEVYREVETGTSSISGNINLDTGEYRITQSGFYSGLITGEDPRLRALRTKAYHAIVKDKLGSCISGLSNIERAGCALSAIVNERELPGNSTDENLRDAEYFVRNYIGRQVLNAYVNGDPIPPGYDDFVGEVVLQNPAAVAGYNAVKAVADFVGLDELTRAQEINPNSNPGGFDASVEGFDKGGSDMTIDEAVTNGLVDETRNNEPIAPLNIPLSSLGDVAPNAENRDVFFLANATPKTVYSFDPLVGVLYDYSLLLGSGIDSIGFSPLFGETLPMDFRLQVFDGTGLSLTLGSGETAFSDDLFEAFGVTSLTDFSVLATSSQLSEYLLDLTFLSNGGVLLAREGTVGDDVPPLAPVPLPGSLPLFLVGLAGLGLMKRKHRAN